MKGVPEAELRMPHVLREYSLLADGERGAVIGPKGDISWMCFPRWDSPSLFSSLIGGSGLYAVTPRGRFVWGGYYEEGSLIWRSRWVTSAGIVECREALAYPGHPGRATLLRRLVAVEGTNQVRVFLHPRAGYGADPARSLRRHEDGTWTAATGLVHLRWSGAPEAEPGPDGHGGHWLDTHLTLAPGQAHDLVLELAEQAPAGQRPDPGAAWDATQAHWSRVVPAMDEMVARRDARHSYAVLAGLTSSGGGMVAAATTSLPERADKGDSYDYRYAWIRDQCFAGEAVAAAGPHSLMDDAVGFVQDRLLADGPQLSPAYTVRGERVPDQHSLGLAGYPGGTDIVGNHVNSQFQLDALGEALLLFAAAAGHDHLELDGWRAAKAAADAIAARWREPDAGIWELSPKRWTHSGLECVAGLRAISSAPGASASAAAEWMALADAILAEVAATSLHPSGRWKRAVDDDRLDAALLLAAIRGALPVDDPRSVATYQAVRSELAEDGYVYRFRHGAGPLGQAEGAFLLCGFWMSLACWDRGDHVEATRWFERNRAACGPPGLFSEEYDVVERQLRGNLPQAFVHAVMLECAARQSHAAGSAQPSGTAS